ncbi:hypothetical protein LEMLEM_LOCUS15015 [Lemmus lemmus]
MMDKNLHPVHPQPSRALLSPRELQLSQGLYSDSIFPPGYSQKQKPLVCKQNGQQFTESGALSLAWWHRLVISATQKGKQGDSQVQGLPGQLSKAMSQTKSKRDHEDDLSCKGLL